MPDWTPIIVEVAILIAAITLLVKKVLPDFVSNKIKESEKTLAEKLSESEYDRARATFREDFAADTLGSTLEWLKGEAEENRKETAKRYDVIQVLSESVARLAQTIGKNTDMIRILAQNSAQIVDRLEDVEKEIHEIKK